MERSRIQRIFTDNRGLWDISHLLLQKLACLLIMIERDNGETDNEPPAVLPSTCPLPAASRFQQMPELIRAAYASPRSRYCYSEACSARGHCNTVYKRKQIKFRYLWGILNYHLLLAKIIPVLRSSLICHFLWGWCDLHLQLLLVHRLFMRLSPTGHGQGAYLVHRN